MAEYDHKAALSPREIVAIRLLLLLLIIIKPMGWSHEISEEIAQLKTAIKEAQYPKIQVTGTLDEFLKPKKKGNK